MKLHRIMIHGLLYGPYMLHKITRTGAFGRQAANYLAETSPNGNNPLKAALFRHHVKQFNEAACSVASVVTVVNAIRDFQGDRSEPITQIDILARVFSAATIRCCVCVAIGPVGMSG